MKTSAILCALCLLAASPLTAGSDAATLRQRIQNLERVGDFAAAVPLYEEWQRLAPDKAPVVRGLARALAAVGKHQRVVALLSVWLNKHPQDGSAALLLGDAHRELGDSEKAVASWRRALDKSATASYSQVADRCRAAGLRREAIRVLREGRKTHAGLYSWELASLYLEEDQYRLSIELFMESMGQAPQRLPVVANRLEQACRSEGTSVLKVLEELQTKAKEPLLVAQLTASCALAAGEADRGIEALAALGDHGADQLFQYGARAEALGHADAASRAYALFAERRPDSPYRYQALSRQAALMAIRDSESALDLYRRLARDFPDRPETLQTLVGIARLQLAEHRDIPKAIASLQTVIDSPRRGPWTPQALALIAECSLRLGDLDQSERFLATLEKRGGPGAYEARYRRAELHYFRGDFTAAEEILSALGEEDPAHPLANDSFYLLLVCEDHAGSNGLATLSRAQLLERQGRTREAEVQWTWLVAHAESALAEWSLLAKARLRQTQGRVSQALDLYERQVAQFPQGEHIVSAQLGQAELYERQGELDKALKTCETALLQHPDDARAPEIRLRIQRLRRLRENG